MVAPRASADVLGIHNRILRVHRPFMTRGYHEEEWQVSRKASVDSAMRIIERQALFNQTPWLRSGWVDDGTGPATSTVETR